MCIFKDITEIAPIYLTARAFIYNKPVCTYIHMFLNKPDLTLKHSKNIEISLNHLF